MKLKELESILYSSRDRIQSTIVYDQSIYKDIETGCSVEYAIEHYGEQEVKRILADNDYLVIII